MRLVIQRVRRASVAVDGATVAQIDKGLLVLVGVENGDADDDARWLAAKTAAMRIFDDAQGVMNLDVRQAGGSVLAVSQFTLTASTRKGNRPGYSRAARGEQARGLYQLYCQTLSQTLASPVAQGVFGAHMLVDLENDGPVTIIIDTRLRE